jgi:3-oxoacyl-[acyl-carrier-protein] synthase-3
LRTPGIFITGIGVFLPAAMSVQQAVAQGRYDADDAELHQLGGAAVAGDTPAPDMALRAARMALRRGGQLPERVGLLLYADSWHQGPDGWQPQYYLQRELIGGRALAVETRHGCNGMFSALEVAASFLLGDAQQQAALIVASDNFGTPLVDRWRMGPGYITGDGASAVVLDRGPGFARLLSVCTVAVPEAEEVHRAGEPLFPPGPTMGRDLDFAARTAVFNRHAGQPPSSVWLTVHQQLVITVEKSLSEAGIAIGDVTRVAFMNYSRQIVEQRGMAALGLPMSMSTWDFGRTVGHLGASDHIVSFDHLLSTGQLGPGEYLLMVSTGPGITISSAVVQVVATPPWADGDPPASNQGWDADG